MKKNNIKGAIIVVLLFILSMASLNLLEDSLLAHTAGIIFLIAGVYGLISIMKTGKFIFN